MKRILCTALSLLMLICLIPYPALAAEMTTADENTVYFDDGSYMVTVIEEVRTRASNTVTQTKSRTYYNSDDVAEWKITLTGTFTYNGTTSSCTSASCNVDVYASNWYTVSKSASKSGNTASCTVTMGKTFLGITISKPVHTLTLTCDKDGNFS